MSIYVACPQTSTDPYRGRQEVVGEGGDAAWQAISWSIMEAFSILWHMAYCGGTIRGSILLTIPVLETYLGVLGGHSCVVIHSSFHYIEGECHHSFLGGWMQWAADVRWTQGATYALNAGSNCWVDWIQHRQSELYFFINLAWELIVEKVCHFKWYRSTLGLSGGRLNSVEHLDAIILAALKLCRIWYLGAEGWEIAWELICCNDFENMMQTI